MNEDLARALAQATRLPSSKPDVSEIWAREILRTAGRRAGTLDHWRHFEPRLDPLKRVLGPYLDAYPQAGGLAA